MPYRTRKYRGRARKRGSYLRREKRAEMRGLDTSIIVIYRRIKQTMDFNGNPHAF